MCCFISLSADQSWEKTWENRQRDVNDVPELELVFFDNYVQSEEGEEGEEKDKSQHDSLKKDVDFRTSMAAASRRYANQSEKDKSIVSFLHPLSEDLLIVFRRSAQDWLSSPLV